MNITIASPWQVIEKKTKQQFSGCLVFSLPKDSSTKWHVYLNDGKLQYATSSRGQKERLTYLWQQFLPDSSFSDFKFTSQEHEEYQQLCSYWREKQLPSAKLPQFLAYLSQEALIQILSFEETSVEVLAEKSLPNSLSNLLWDELIEKIKPEINLWQELRSYLSSTLNRLYLGQGKSFQFYKLWKKLVPNLEDKSQKESHKVSFWIEALSDKDCLYQLATKTGSDPLLIAQQFKPFFVANLIEILPFEELAKPQKQTSFTTTSVATNTSKPIPSEPTNRTATSNAIKNPVVACIDDSKTVQRQVKMTLESVGYEVIEIVDPTNALKGLARQQPVMILMDINMPEINGYDLCSMLRRSQKFQEIPIVMLTGRDGIIDRVRAKFVGATDYLTKPFLPEQLIEIVATEVVVKEVCF